MIPTSHNREKNIPQNPSSLLASKHTADLVSSLRNFWVYGRSVSNAHGSVESSDNAIVRIAFVFEVEDEVNMAAHLGRESMINWGAKQ
jgi:hypothetical protein